METTYELLSTYICRKDYKEVSNILKQDNSVNVISDDGELFIAAINNADAKSVKALLHYFENNQLAKFSDNSYQYYTLKQKMQRVLENAIEDVELSEEMKEMLSRYIDFEGEDEEQKLKDLDDQINYEKQNAFFQVRHGHNELDGCTQDVNYPKPSDHVLPTGENDNSLTDIQALSS